MKEKRRKLIKYINDKIDDCLIEDRIEILNMIVQKSGGKNLYEENTGTRILYKHIHNILLINIKEFIDISLKKTLLNFSSDDN